MKKPLLIILPAMFLIGVARADLLDSSSNPADVGLSADQLDILDQHGYFPPAFKASVHALVENKQALQAAKLDEVQIKAQLPAAHQAADAAEAKVAALREELAVYADPVESDFVALKKMLADPAGAPADQLPVAQAYVWTFPASPHAAEALQLLAAVQKKIADQSQSEKDAAVAHAAEQAKLKQRALAHDLSMPEWQNFLNGRSQDEVVTMLGRPAVDGGDYWIYRGAWVVEPKSGQKVGLEISFNAGRVQTATFSMPTTSADGL